MSRAKRHHFVPRAYLERFAQSGTLLVRRRDSKLFETSPRNVAVECGFYEVPDHTEGGKSSRIEELLADIDGAAITAIRWIDSSGRPQEKGEERLVLALFMALQITRTPEMRERVLFPERVAQYAGDRELTKELVSQFLQHEYLGFRPSKNEASAAFDYVSVALEGPKVLTREFAIEMMLRSVEQIAPRLEEMNWTVEIDRKERLITSDLPIVIWSAPTSRDQYEGIGVANAEEIRFPLDPSKQLVLSKRTRTPTARINSGRVRFCNADTAAACHRSVIGRPNQRAMLNAVPLRERGPVLRFNTAIVRTPTGWND